MHRGASRTRAAPQSPRPIRGLSWPLNGPARRDVGATRVLEASRRLGFLLSGYVLMPDHWHALIRAPYPLLLWQVLHGPTKIMTLRLHVRRGSRGPLWQHQYWDRFVRDEEEFNERLEYVHLNPVKKGLVKRREDGRWSSYNNFALDKATVAARPIQIDYVRLPWGYRA